MMKMQRTSEVPFSTFDEFFGGHLPTLNEQLTIVIGDQAFHGTVVKVDHDTDTVTVAYFVNHQQEF